MPTRREARFSLFADSLFPLEIATRYDESGRNGQIRRMLERVAGEADPVIVAGDFNMSDQAVIYGEIAARLRDAFREAGTGFGASWPTLAALGMPPLIRIDYIWHSEHFRAAAAERGPRLGSDHLPHAVTLLMESPSP